MKKKRATKRATKKKAPLKPLSTVKRGKLLDELYYNRTLYYNLFRQYSQLTERKKTTELAKLDDLVLKLVADMDKLDAKYRKDPEFDVMAAEIDIMQKFHKKLSKIVLQI